MNSRILNTITNAIESKEDVGTRIETGKGIFQDLLSCVQNCQNRFGGKSELATEDDIRIVQLCEKWENVLSHGIRTNLSNSAIQNLVSAGLNFTFNIVNIGNSLWSYTCLHLTKHEKERFKILSNIHSPLGYFRAFLRASLNERSLERYLHSWIGHGLLMEYYEEGSIVRVAESSSLLPNMAAGLSSILFALSIDRSDLNETQQTNHVNKVELIIPAPVPLKTNQNKRKPLRQVISFDKAESSSIQHKDEKTSQSKTLIDESSCYSAPPTCLSSPDPKINSYHQASTSEPSSSDVKSIRQFFPESVRAMDSPSQILSRLSECAKEMFSTTQRDDVSERSISNLKISESDSEEVAGSINGSISCLELCFTEDEAAPDDKYQSLLAQKDQEYIALQSKCTQIEVSSKDKVSKLEKVVLDLSKENERLKEQLRTYISAVETGIALKTAEDDNDEVKQYEKKLVQVAEMHAELMEFNQYLQKRLQDMESVSTIDLIDCPTSNVKVCVPSAFLIGKKAYSYHVYQIFVKIGQEEWNVYHRYTNFRELHMQLKKCHQDIANYKFPPKKAIGKKDSRLVEQRRTSLQAYLRHIVLVLPDLRNCSTRAELVSRLPFFGLSSNRENGITNHIIGSRSIEDSTSYAAL